MKKYLRSLIIFCSCLFLCSCGTDEVTSNSNTNSNQSTNEGNSSTNGISIISSNNSGVINVTGISLSKNTLTLSQYDNYLLYEYFAPTNATNKNVTWSSTNTDVATVSPYGYVHALNAGTATIKVVTEDGGYVATCNVTVVTAYVPPAVNVTSVTLNRETATIEEEKTLSLTAYVEPWNATNSNVSWASSNNEVATVDKNGVVTGISKGSVTITVTTEDGGFKASCVVTVVEKTIFDFGVGKTTVKVLQNSIGKRLLCYTPIENKGNVNITLYSCSFTVNDKEGNLIQSISEYYCSCSANIIKPGETVYYRGDYSYSGDLSESELVATISGKVKNASSYDAKRLDVSEVAIKRDTYNQIKLTGKVTNNLDSTATLPYVSYDIFDSNNNYVFGDDSLLMDDVPAGGSVNFEIGTLLDSYFKDLNVDDCYVIVKAYEYQFILFL